MEQWRFAAQELPKIRDRELRAMTDQQAIMAAVLVDPVRGESGMVVMQQLFGKLRKSATS